LVSGSRLPFWHCCYYHNCYHLLLFLQVLSTEIGAIYLWSHLLLSTIDYNLHLSGSQVDLNCLLQGTVRKQWSWDWRSSSSHPRVLDLSFLIICFLILEKVGPLCARSKVVFLALHPVCTLNSALLEQLACETRHLDLCYFLDIWLGADVWAILTWLFWWVQKTKYLLLRVVMGIR
jgi:hypothetical protein